MLKFISNHKLPSMLVLLLLTLGLPMRAFGQVDQGSISGSVKDTSGGSIAGAAVTLTNDDTGVTQTATTNGNGEYIFAPIKIGHYTLTAEFKGFQKVQQKNVTVDVQQKVLVDIALPPALRPKRWSSTKRLPRCRRRMRRSARLSKSAK